MTDKEPEITTTTQDNAPEEKEENKSVEQKLGDLMMQGWTMLADACFKESCQTPLMRDNVTKQVYCVGCEAWVCTKEKTHNPMRYRQLVSLEGKRNVQPKGDHSEVSTLNKKKVNIDSPGSFKGVMEAKLIEFTGWLKTEKDVKKCNEILDAITKTMAILQDFNSHYQHH